MSAKNIISLKNIYFDNTNFWAYFLSVNYPCAFMEESDCSMYDFVKEILPVDTKWSDEFTGYYDGILDETDGYLDEPTTLLASIGNSDILKIEFHPGDTIFYINEIELGCTGPHCKLQKIPYHQIKKLLHLEDGEILFQLLLPMTILKPDETDDLKSVLEEHFSKLGFTQPILSKMIDCLIYGIIII